VGAVCVLAALALSGCGSAASSPRGRSSGPRDTATRIASELQARVVVPSGATLDTATLPSELAQAEMAEGTSNLVDQHHVWIVPEPSTRTRAFEQTHPPRGMTVVGPDGQSGGGGRLTVNFFGFDAPSFASPSGPIASAQLLVAVAARTATTSYLRVDAQVVWRPTRDAATIVPARDRVVTVTTKGQAHVVADATTVDRIARVFNALPVTPPGESSCPPQNGVYAIAFARTRSSGPDITASLMCDNFIEADAHGHRLQLDSSEAIKAILGFPS
jgi:uncharacterized protein YceK